MPGMAYKDTTDYKGRTMGDWKITHTVPAPPGWWARWIDEPVEHSWVSPVAFWVVAEDKNGRQQMLGVDPTGGDFWQLSEPIHQDVRYFYDPEFTGSALGTSDPGPGGKG